MPGTASRRPPHNSPESVVPDLTAFLGIWRKSKRASARWTSMGNESTRTSENCKTLKVHVSNRLCAREVESSDQQGPFVRCARSEQLSAVSAFERVHAIDVSHDNCSHADLAIVFLRDGFVGRTLFRETLCNPTCDVIRTKHMSALRWWTPTAMRGCGWTLRKARTGGTSTRGRHSGTRLGSAEVPQNQFIDVVVVVACGCLSLASLDKSGGGGWGLLPGTPNVIWSGLAFFWLQFRESDMEWLGFFWLQ